MCSYLNSNYKSTSHLLLAENVARSLIHGIPVNNNHTRPRMRDVAIQTRAMFDFSSRSRNPKRRDLQDAGASAAAIAGAAAEGDKAAAAAGAAVGAGYVLLVLAQCSSIIMCVCLADVMIKVRLFSCMSA